VTSAGYRFRNYVTRHRVGVGAALIVALSLVGGTLAAVTQASRATRQAELAAGKHAEAAALFGLAVSHQELGQFEEAEALLRPAIETIRRSQDPGHHILLAATRVFTEASPSSRTPRRVSRLGSASTAKVS